MTEHTEHRPIVHLPTKPAEKPPEVKAAPKPAPKRPAPKKPAPKKIVYDAAYLHEVLKHYELVLIEPFGRPFAVGTGTGMRIEVTGFPENVPGRRDEWDLFDPPALVIGGRAYPVTNP